MMLKMVTNTQIKNKIITRLNNILKSEVPSDFDFKITKYINLLN